MDRMQSRALVAIAAMTWTLLTVGCGAGTAPTISDLTLATPTVAAGGQLGGQVNVADADGLGGLKLALTLAGAGLTQPEQLVPVTNASDSMQAALVPFVVLIAGGAPAGSYTLTVTAIDGDGERSNQLTASFTITP